MFFLTAILAFISATLITAISIPRIIAVSVKKHLMDMPDDGRKQHRQPTPTLGGAGIYLSCILVASVANAFYPMESFSLLLASVTLLFIIGLTDDLIGMSVYKRLLTQAAAATLIVIAGGVQIEHMGGLFGIQELPETASQIFSIFAMIIILNAYNLIDGADGLAGTVGIITAGTFSVLLFMNGAYPEALLALILAGALLGFLFYNVEPARIFMGDGGSMMIGFLLAFLGVSVMQANLITAPVWIPSVAVFVFAVLIIPMYDTLRSITLRVYHGRSPLSPDANHLHHVLQRFGYSHRGVVLVIALANLTILATAFMLRTQDVHLMLAVTLLQAWLILPVAKRFMKWLQQLEARRFTRMITSAVTANITVNNGAANSGAASHGAMNGNGNGNGNIPTPGLQKKFAHKKNPLEAAELF
jgi:UDP-GlcNAc:undecaprenyl-phosphate/decaprenyl-phosphate GlcNAc-1-phosphate transferase